MNVPIKANRGPTLTSNHLYIPLFSPLIAEPYSAIIKAKGIKNKIAAIT